MWPMMKMSFFSINVNVSMKGCYTVGALWLANDQSRVYPSRAKKSARTGLQLPRLKRYRKWLNETEYNCHLWMTAKMLKLSQKNWNTQNMAPQCFQNMAWGAFYFYSVKWQENTADKGCYWGACRRPHKARRLRYKSCSFCWNNATHPLSKWCVRVWLHAW